MKYPRIEEVAAVLVIIAVLGMMIVIGWGQRYAAVEGEAFRWSIYVFGTAGGLAAILGAMTFVAVGLTVWMLFVRAEYDNKQFRLAEQSARLSQFKEGATLLASANQSASLSGALLLVTLAQTWRPMIEAVAQVLGTYVHTATRDDFLAMQAYIDRPTADRALPVPRGRQTGAAAVGALSYIGSIRHPPGTPWPADANLGEQPGRLLIAQVYLGNVLVLGADLSFCDLRAVIAWRLTFRRCNLRNAVIEVFADDWVRFEECDLEGATILARDYSRRQVNAGGDAAVITDRCRVNANSTINNQPLATTAEY